VDAENIVRSQRWNVGDVQAFMVVFGLISTAFDLLTFFILLAVFAADAETFRTAWFVVSVLTELAVVLILRTQGSALLSRPSNLLLGSTIAVCLLTLGIPYLGKLAGIFDFVPLGVDMMLAMGAIVIAYGAATEAAKRRFFRKRQRWMAK
jgi:Mg2+-importing ATPase